MLSFTIHEKRIDIYPASEPDAPVIYLNTYTNTVGTIYQSLLASDCPVFNLVAISNLQWEHDMTPWSMQPVFEHANPCTGGADDYLMLLLNSIIPKAEKYISGTPAWRGIAGYSLAGLFAVYALYRTNIFSRAASMSGSFWFAGFTEFIHSNKMQHKPDCIYFSIGDKESLTNNPILKVVQNNTQAMENFYKSQNIETIFVLNKGGHHQAVNKRTAAGICWMLNRTINKDK